MRQAAPTEVQQFEHLVERRRIAAAGSTDRIGALEARHQITGQHRLAGAHPVAVALHRVDLAVVGDEAIRVGQRPRREGVGAEPAVHQRQRAFEPLVTEVGEEDRQLRSGEHALVEQRATAERREVRLLLDRQFVLDAFTGNEHLAIEIDAGGADGVADEQLSADRHDRLGTGAKALRVDRHVAPAEHGQALIGDDRLDQFLGLLRVGRGQRQKRQADRVGTCRWEFETDDLAKESVGHLDQDAGSVTRVGFGAGCTAVLQVAERAEAHGHDRPAGNALHAGDERNAASVVFEPRVIETLRRGKARLSWSAHLF